MEFSRARTPEGYGADQHNTKETTLPTSDFDRDEVHEEKRASPSRDAAADRPQELEWASAVGNSAVQRIARSASGRRVPVGPGAMPLATRALARQADDDEMATEGGAATATAEAPAAAEGADSAAPAAEGAPAQGAESAAPAAEPSTAEGLEEESV
jgi:hypothetical protein